jgi:hypothetical protein
VLRAFFQPRILIRAIILGWLATGGVTRADDEKPTAPPGYKLVAVKLGNRTGYVQVKDDQNPFGSMRDSGEGHGADHFAYNTTSPMANKTYQAEAAGESSARYQDKMQGSFITRSYVSGADTRADETVPNFHSQVPVHGATGYGRSADGFSKSFQTTGDALDQNRSSALGAKTASESGRAAVLGGHDIKTFAYAGGDKTYGGPEALAVKRDLDRMNNGLETLKDLPSRPLTIDEVRALINHGVKPDLDQKPAPASKPLNDPDYLPDAAPAPERTPGGVDLHDANDLSTPGAVAHPDLAVPEPAPENSQPLPQ